MRRYIPALVLLFISGALRAESGYTTLTAPCRIVDTRLAGGRLEPGISRNFKVKGTAGFESQGGTPGGCGVPAAADAVAINFVAVNPQGTGNLRASAYPDPLPAAGSIINYQALSPALNLANGLQFPLCSGTSCDFDLTVQPNGAGTDLVADVIGYFSSDGELTYTTFQRPCRIIDTRVAGGQLEPGVPRDFHVAGEIGFPEQGGTLDGCGVPEGSLAAMINFVAVGAQGPGNLKGSAYPTPIPATGNVINYQMLTPPLNIANGLIFPLCEEATCSRSITLQANGAGVHVVADVLGFFGTTTVPDIQPSRQNLLYTSFAQPCRIIDTRNGSGALTAGVSRNFKVAGSSGFESQGGAAGGCGIPQGATVAMINFVAVGAQGTGNLRASAYPNEVPTTGSIINYQALTPPLNIANGLLFPICDPKFNLCDNDIRLLANGSNVHVVADVMGYARPIPFAVLNADALSPTSVRVTFNREVSASTLLPDGSQFTFDQGLIATAASASGTFVIVTTTTQSAATTYTVSVSSTVTDSRGRFLGPENSAQFTGFAPEASLVINELNANITSGCDLIEVLVTAGGSIGGFRIQERTGGANELNYTFPSMNVEEGDMIVVHLNSGSTLCNPGGATQETLSKTDQPVSLFGGNFDTAFDFWASDGGLTSTDNVFTIFDDAGVIIDAVFASDDPAAASTAAATETAAAAVGMANQWSPAQPSYIDADFRINAAHDLNATGTTKAGNSMQRVINGLDTNSKEDWTTGSGELSSWGMPNTP